MPWPRHVPPPESLPDERVRSWITNCALLSFSAARENNKHELHSFSWFHVKLSSAWWYWGAADRPHFLYVLQKGGCFTCFCVLCSGPRYNSVKRMHLPNIMSSAIQIWLAAKRRSGIQLALVAGNSPQPVYRSHMESFHKIPFKIATLVIHINLDPLTSIKLAIWNELKCFHLL